MDDKKRKKIIWLAIILFVIMGILFLVMRLSDQPVEQEDPMQESINDQPVFEPRSAEVEFEVEEIIDSPEVNTQFTVENLAKSYASRLGSWSTDNRGKNLQELLSLSTLSMQNYLNSRDLGAADAEFMGITTKSISSKIISLDDDSAEVLVGTQRIETDKDLNENIYYQDIEISLIKNNDRWLVNEAYWQ